MPLFKLLEEISVTVQRLALLSNVKLSGALKPLCLPPAAKISKSNVNEPRSLLSSINLVI